MLEDKQLESVQRERIQLTKDEGHIDNEITAVLGSMDSLELAHTEHRWGAILFILQTAIISLQGESSQETLRGYPQSVSSFVSCTCETSFAWKGSASLAMRLRYSTRGKDSQDLCLAKKAGQFLQYRHTFLTGNSAFSENLKRLEAAIQAGDEQMHSLDSAVQSKKKAIAENEKLLQFEDLHTSELHAELGTKELGKLTQAEVEESRSLERQLLQWQVAVFCWCPL